jgi:aminoglycoside 6'-N-acetyltransferase
MGNLTGEQSIISFRKLGRSDFPLLQKWFAAPHVAVWWNERFDLASLEAKYGPAIDGSEPIHVYLIQSEGVPIGWIQWYRWRDFPKRAIQVGAGPMWAGIDLAIGEVEMTGRGLGPAVIREFGTNYIFTNGDVGAIVADPSTINRRSVSAFRKAGFKIVDTVQLVDEPFERHIVRLDRGESEMSSRQMAQCLTERLHLAEGENSSTNLREDGTVHAPTACRWCIR